MAAHLVYTQKEIVRFYYWSPKGNCMQLKAGQIVKLKSLDEICKMQKVSIWEQITNPMLNSKGMMNHFFGGKIRIAYSAKIGQTFSAYDVDGRGEDQNWSFNKDWIDTNIFEMELIQDDLFKI